MLNRTELERRTFLLTVTRTTLRSVQSSLRAALSAISSTFKVEMISWRLASLSDTSASMVRQRQGPPASVSVSCARMVTAVHHRRSLRATLDQRLESTRRTECVVC